MHRNRKSKHRKMLKPKFYSSSSDDDIGDEDDAVPLKWKPIIASFPVESNIQPKQSNLIELNPIIDSLNAKMSKQQQKLSAEVIQKEEIYNQAEMEANKKMFGSTNPGRCLSKDEIKRRKEIILRIVNDRLKSKLSELMGEFGERTEMNDDDDDTYENSRFNVEDEDSIPEAPPPPTFNTSSESSDVEGDDLDTSMTKEFELYEKEIKEKTLNARSIVSTSTTTSTAISLTASYNSVQICPSNSTPNSQIQVLEQQTANYQQNWQQPAADAPWFPPVGPPQIMDPFPPPIESESNFMVPPPNFATFPNANPPTNNNNNNGWINATSAWTNPTPAWTNPTLTNFPSNFSTIAQYPNPEWNNSQSTAYTPFVPPQMHFATQITPRMNWNVTGHRPSRPSYVRPTSAVYNGGTVVRPNVSLNPIRNQAYPSPSTNNVSVSIVSKSTFVNAILAAEQKVTTSTSKIETKVTINDQINASAVDEQMNGNVVDDSCTKINRKSPYDKDSNTRKRPYEQKIEKVECVANSTAVVHADTNSNESTKRVCLDDSKVKKTRFDNPKQNEKQQERENRINSPNDQNKKKQLEQKELIDVKVDNRKTAEIETRHEKHNSEALKFLSKIWNTKNANSDTVAKNSKNDRSIVPIEWIKLCDIVDKLLDLSPNTLKDLPLTDRRVKERNELLIILSNDPENFYAHADKYGEHNVKWAVKMAERILFPQGRYDESIALQIAPFQKAINSALNTSNVSTSAEKEINGKISIPSKQSAKPKEWIKLCKIVDKLLDIPTRIIESLPSSDSRVKERNDILVLLSKEPEDFLLHDDKYGSHNVDWAILAAKRILCPDGVCDERVRKVMLRQRDILLRGYSTTDRSISRDRESLKRANHKTVMKADEHRSRSLPKEWHQLCEIVDKVLDTPKEIRIKMSKRDPRWELRDNILLLLIDDPDKLASQRDGLGRVNVDWAIKSSKKILFPNGSKDRTILKKLSPQRKLLLRNCPPESSNDENVMNEMKTAAAIESSKQGNTLTQKQTNQRNDNKGQVQMVGVKRSNEKEQSLGKKIRISKQQESKVNKTSAPDKKSIKEPETIKVEAVTTAAAAAAEKEIDAKEVWLKLCNIVDKLLDLPPNAADKLEPTDKRLIERNDILMILSDDPENFSKFEGNYGNTNVTWAVKSAKKLIYSNGKPNEKLIDALWKQRDAIIFSEEMPKEESQDTSNNECYEWKCVRKIATKAFLLSHQGIEKKKGKLTKQQLYDQIELLLQLSDNPDVVRSKPICKKIGEGRVEVAIAKCKHILNRMRKLNPKALLNFENLRTKMVLYSESLNQSKNIKNYDVILTEVRKIVDQKLFNEIYGQNFKKWTNEQKLERNELAILLIKDSQFLRSNAKYLEIVRKTEKPDVDEIVAEVEKCLLKCEYVKEKPMLISAPIIAKIKDVKYMNPFKERKLTQRIHRLIEQFLIAPKPEIFDVVFDDTDGTVDVVCANDMTFNWLKDSINELDGLWPNAKITICKAPITRRVLKIDDLKEIQMAFKTVPTESFAVIMKQLKKSNPKLNTERWHLKKKSDQKKMIVMVDLESLIELERSKREIIVESGTIYFDIKYIGRENFETKC